MPRPAAKPDAPPRPAAGEAAQGADNLRGVAWMLFSVAAASAMTVAVRALSEDIDSRMIVFLRAGVTLALIAPLLALPAFRARLRFSRPWMHAARGLMIAVSTQMGFYAIAHLPLATSTVLFFTAPIFATLLAGPVNGERVGPRRWAAVLTGFAGALIILRPGFAAPEPAMLVALGSSLLFASALSTARGLAQADGPVSTYVSSVAATALVALPAALPVWRLPEGGAAWAALATLVAAGAARGVADIQAYRHGEASVVGVVAYLRLVLIGGAGYLMFSEIPDAATVAGGAVIVGATLYIAQREARLRRARREPRAMPAD
ncbi:DMT family transporter [Oceanicella actignis]|uniref:Permease of the drug/metabolite transporter (DMT) superfamily n=1 Tax=Oceanicella actignis TaxID=1189325 RepID=A0A1M7SFV4_9RHOB|nr:DMT family transporter [Oceanicella actignis]TYO91287.1 drug/metabolite transporter (DMT)-like permease [Oceanicella actignis]SET21739.1 Permease of the drug/metabolite transporter (DMT) superfamily [Oceanicella actignis]SHN57388.1 Permease of the drug/metabolite transporter (DMT) superfamily [Oceanicella actignis]